MPNYWVVKTEPSTYGFADLVKQGTAVWDGVKNPVALKNLKAMAVGDEVLVYHTGDEKSAVGLATVVKTAYPDPKSNEPNMVVVDLKAGRLLPKAVTLATIKADDAFADMPLVRMPRLSVMPASPAQWKRLLELGGLPR